MPCTWNYHLIIWPSNPLYDIENSEITITLRYDMFLTDSTSYFHLYKPNVSFFIEELYISMSQV